MVRLLRARSVSFVAGAFVLAGIGGCTDRSDDTTLRDAAIYLSVINDVAEHSDVSITDEADGVQVIHVESFAPDGIPIEVQVEVIAGFIDQHDIRFIDDIDEVIDPDLVDRPVRNGAMLIGLGPITVEGAAELRSELYRSKDDIVAYRYRLEHHNDTWAVTGEPETIEPEGFVASS